ncbi:putative alpha,alpha-trehalose-phosphate synthase (UDP-forming) [Helianthus annuus]|uniref:Alpha,alpha-trehalose-phosphate synthase (UDP-forming) n=1 Tax=Helianthus annuus TaxID=4232 RepID=A0A251U8I6_HELAN|nr:putative alpha,alpha-trehalose-phosphate synthase (UDP-forming) [Helianthus annuus]KAJ0441062.1 putative alpha,alpha-trehalose-phosphate synthase (UDP-forming) [Helianthus annuus]KAJ0834294.1 putative alpha,alpha-trehalose-phosphate synthase (UDP-forming) [Helianthus annuus]
MRLYTEATDGSSIEVKESGLVWHHQDADPDFGSCRSGGDIFFRPLRVERRCLFRARVHIG